MSIESARAYVERVKTDEDFSKKVLACKDSEERTVFVQAAGYDFNLAEIKSINEELSDSELECISGGAYWCNGYAEGERSCIGEK